MVPTAAYYSLDTFLMYFILDVTTNCICEVHCLALDGFDRNALQKLGSKEKRYHTNWYSNLGLLGGKQECNAIATATARVVKC